MESFRFIHASDLHLDSPCSGVKRVTPELQKKLQDATFRAWEKIVDSCIEYKVDFLTIAGDLYDQPERSLRAQVHVREQLKKLERYGIQVYMIHGNHDHCGGRFAAIQMPDNVHVFPAGKWEMRSFCKNEREIARLYGISYPKQAVTERYVNRIQKDAGAPYSIGLLHTNVAAWSEHENYAPATIEELAATGINFWGLGHIHTPRIVKQSQPTIIYPGNPQGRHIREQGARGCYLVQVDSYGDSQLTFLPTDQIRWLVIESDISEYESEDELLDFLLSEIKQLADLNPKQSLVVRLRLQGHSVLHADLQEPNHLVQLQDALQTMLISSLDDVWIESVENNIVPDYDLETLRKQPNFVGDYLGIVQELSGSNEDWEEIRALLHEFYGAGKPLPALQDDEFRSLLQKAGLLGLQLLLEAE